MRARHWVWLWSVLAVAALPDGALAATYEIDASHSSVGFRIRHLVGRVNGNFTRFQGTFEFDEKAPAKSKVTATIDAASINTANEARRASAKRRLFVAKARITREPEGDACRQGAIVVGTLTMRGVSRYGSRCAQRGGADPWGGKRAGFTATKLNRKDWYLVEQTLDRGGAVLGDEVR